jgi:hypothetical protein
MIFRKIGATVFGMTMHWHIHRVLSPCVLQLLVAVNVVPSSLVLSTLMMEAIHASEMLVLTKATWHGMRRIHS